jgi:hypothetical protein
MDMAKKKKVNQYIKAIGFLAKSLVKALKFMVQMITILTDISAREKNLLDCTQIGMVLKRKVLGIMISCMAK